MSIEKFSNSIGLLGLKETETGKIILDCDYLSISHIQYNNCVVVQKEVPKSYSWTQSINNTHYTEGLFDVEKRKFVLECKYRGIWDFDKETGLACVVKRHDGHSSGFINRNGDVIIPLEYDMPWHEYFDTNKGMTLRRSSDGKYGVVDNENRIKLPFEYDNLDAGRFFSSEPLSGVSKNKLWGYVDRNYQIIIPCRYQRAGNFFEVGGYWRALVTDSSGKELLIDTNGHSIIPPKYSSFKIRIGQEYYAMCFYQSFFRGVQMDIISTIDGHIISSSDAAAMDHRTKDLLARGIIYASVSAAKGAIKLLSSALGYPIPIPDGVTHAYSQKIRDLAWQEYEKTGSIIKAIEIMIS